MRIIVHLPHRRHTSIKIIRFRGLTLSSCTITVIHRNGGTSHQKQQSIRFNFSGARRGTARRANSSPPQPGARPCPSPSSRTAATTSAARTPSRVATGPTPAARTAATGKPPPGLPTQYETPAQAGVFYVLKALLPQIAFLNMLQVRLY